MRSGNLLSQFLRVFLPTLVKSGKVFAAKCNVSTLKTLHSPTIFAGKPILLSAL